MATLIALVDYENTGSLEGINFSLYEKVVVFSGALQEHIRLPVTMPAEGVCIAVRRIPAVAKNNVDFHLVLMLGQLSISMPPEAGFHVVSRDKGYDGVIDQLRQSGRRCQRVEPEILPDDNTVVSWVEQIVSRARSKPANLPATPKALDNYLKSATGLRRDDRFIRDIRNELVRRRMVRVYEKTVIWSISMPPRSCL